MTPRAALCRADVLTAVQADRNYDAADDRVRTMLVAGPAALLVAKVHKIVERLRDRDRAQDKDALDVLGCCRQSRPYVDPGQELAPAARHELRRFHADTGRWPRVLLAGNHGVFTFGDTLRQALEMTVMTEKNARITIAAASIGRVTPLVPSEVQRIGSREDEAYRRRLLSTS